MLYQFQVANMSIDWCGLNDLTQNTAWSIELNNWEIVQNRQLFPQSVVWLVICKPPPPPSILSISSPGVLASRNVFHRCWILVPFDRSRGATIECDWEAFNSRTQLIDSAGSAVPPQTNYHSLCKHLSILWGRGEYPDRTKVVAGKHTKLAQRVNNITIIRVKWRVQEILLGGRHVKHILCWPEKNNVYIELNCCPIILMSFSYHQAPALEVFIVIKSQ